jgi:hypothetical protein
MYIFICQMYLPCDDSVFSLIFSPADDSAAAAAALPPSSRLVRLLSAPSSLSPAAVALLPAVPAAAKLSAAQVRQLLMLEELLYPDEN